MNVERCVAVDWSGARDSGGRGSLGLAEVSASGVRIDTSLDRAGILRELRALKDDPAAVVGMDFAFSFPSWYVQERECVSALDMWELAAREGEDWLHSRTPPFWGWKGTTCPSLPAHLRRTEEAAPRMGGRTPKSVFQVSGAGTVGTGSIRGMPYLLDLSRAGFAIWPFDDGRTSPDGRRTRPLVVEIYPRVLTGRVVKNDAAERAAYLHEHCSALDPSTLAAVTCSEDAFDALVSALVMWRHRNELAALTRTDDDVVRREGWIWWPRDGGTPASARVSGSSVSPWRVVRLGGSPLERWGVQRDAGGGALARAAVVGSRIEADAVCRALDEVWRDHSELRGGG